jgi:hypothetical protein
MDHQKLDEDILGLTGSPAWTESLMKLLEAEAAASLQNQLEATSWDAVVYFRGYRAALEFVANIRETTKMLMEQSDADV